jgi:hypothetical protein
VSASMPLRRSRRGRAPALTSSSRARTARALPLGKYRGNRPSDRGWNRAGCSGADDRRGVWRRSRGCRARRRRRSVDRLQPPLRQHARKHRRRVRQSALSARPVTSVHAHLARRATARTRPLGRV